MAVGTFLLVLEDREFSAVYFTLPFVGDAWIPLETAAVITLIWFGYLRFAVWTLFELPHNEEAAIFAVQLLSQVHLVELDES